MVSSATASTLTRQHCYFTAHYRIYETTKWGKLLRPVFHEEDPDFVWIILNRNNFAKVMQLTVGYDKNIPEYVRANLHPRFQLPVFEPEFFRDHDHNWVILNHPKIEDKNEWELMMKHGWTQIVPLYDQEHRSYYKVVLKRSPACNTRV